MEGARRLPEPCQPSPTHPARTIAYLTHGLYPLNATRIHCPLSTEPQARKFRQATLWRADLLVERKKTAARKKIEKWMDRILRGRRARRVFLRQLHLTYSKVWDVKEGQAFWYNFHRKAAVWVRPRLLSLAGRYGDVAEACPWVPVDVTLADRARRAEERQQRLLAEGPAAVAAAKVNMHHSLSFLSCALR